MRAIQAHYARREARSRPCELETIAQTWSEHCKHKTFTGEIDFGAAALHRQPAEAHDQGRDARARKPWCVSVFHDNAGIVAFDQGFDVCIKVETHNHPSAIDPTAARARASAA
jgi:phosphoribosylformylglycinamidine synthase